VLHDDIKRWLRRVIWCDAGLHKNQGTSAKANSMEVCVINARLSRESSLDRKSWPSSETVGRRSLQTSARPPTMLAETIPDFLVYLCKCLGSILLKLSLIFADSVNIHLFRTIWCRFIKIQTCRSVKCKQSPAHDSRRTTVYAEHSYPARPSNSIS
jgi:hypothetical protein